MSQENQVAETILKQLGGNKFIAMTGAKQFVDRGESLSFKIGRNSTSTNYILITLDASDTYTVSFQRVTMSRKTFETKTKVIQEHSMTYADQLQNLFTEVTGLYTSL